MAARKTSVEQWKPIREDPPKFRPGSRAAIWDERLTQLQASPNEWFRVFTGPRKDASNLGAWLRKSPTVVGYWEFEVNQVDDENFGVWAKFLGFEAPAELSSEASKI